MSLPFGRLCCNRDRIPICLQALNGAFPPSLNFQIMSDLCHNHLNTGTIACQATFVLFKVAYLWVNLKSDNFLKMSKEFGKLLRHHRKLNGLSQEKLRDKIEHWGPDYDKSAISKWETGLHVPPAEVVEILEDILFPRSNGLLLKAAGYRYQAEDSFPSVEHIRGKQSPQSKKIQTTALILASNLEKIRNAPAESLGDPFGRKVYTVGKKIYGGWWTYEDQAKLGDVDRKLAPKLFKRLKAEGEFPELADISNWRKLKETHNTEDFIQHLIARAHRGDF